MGCYCRKIAKTDQIKAFLTKMSNFDNFRTKIKYQHRQANFDAMATKSSVWTSCTQFGPITNTTQPIFFCDPVVLESICYHTRAKLLINDGNTTGGLRKF